MKLDIPLVASLVAGYNNSSKVHSFACLAGHEIMLLLLLLLLSTLAAAAAADDNALTTSGKCIEKAKTEKLSATAATTKATAAETTMLTL